MPHAYYIGCDSQPVENNNGSRLQCTYNNGATAYSLQDITDEFAPQLTADDGAIFATVIFATSMLSWGFRLALKQLNLGV